MPIDQIILLITGVAACLSAIAALLAVQQISKQRMESYKPGLVIVRTPIRSQAEEEPISFNWTIPNADNVSSPNDSKSFSVPLWNVGLGAAKEVKIHWNFPIDKLVSRVNRLAQESLTPIHFKWTNVLLEIESDNFSCAYNWPAQKELDIDFILPASIDQTASKLIIPQMYIELVSYLVYFVAKVKKFDQNISKIPPLECLLDYNDIGGAKHSVKFALNVNCYHIKDNGAYFRGFLDSSLEE